jgi:hypothetical protein
MLLYNIIETIRNFCIDNPLSSRKLEINDEYSFSVGKNKTYEFICNKIKEIAAIVSTPDKASFIEKANTKVPQIKKKGLLDQFNL